MQFDAPIDDAAFDISNFFFRQLIVVCKFLLFQNRWFWLFSFRLQLLRQCSRQRQPPWPIVGTPTLISLPVSTELMWVDCYVYFLCLIMIILASTIPFVFMIMFFHTLIVSVFYCSHISMYAVRTQQPTRVHVVLWCVICDCRGGTQLTRGLFLPF